MAREGRHQITRVELHVEARERLEGRRPARPVEGVDPHHPVRACQQRRRALRAEHEPLRPAHPPRKSRAADRPPVSARPLCLIAARSACIVLQRAGVQGGGLGGGGGPGLLDGPDMRNQHVPVHPHPGPRRPDEQVLPREPCAGGASTQPGAQRRNRHRDGIGAAGALRAAEAHPPSSAANCPPRHASHSALSSRPGSRPQLAWPDAAAPSGSAVEKYSRSPAASSRSASPSLHGTGARTGPCGRSAA